MTIPTTPNTIYRGDGAQLKIPQYMRFSPQPDITVQEIAKILEVCSLAIHDYMVTPEIARHFKEVEK